MKAGGGRVEGGQDVALGSGHGAERGGLEPGWAVRASTPPRRTIKAAAGGARRQESLSESASRPLAAASLTLLRVPHRHRSPG